MVTPGLENASPAKANARNISVMKKIRDELSNISDQGVCRYEQG
jgi:hypothetical protein